MKRDFGQNNGKGKIKSKNRAKEKFFLLEICKKGLSVAVRKSD